MTKYFNQYAISAIFCGLVLFTPCSSIAKELLANSPQNQVQGIVMEISPLMLERAESGDSLAMLQLATTYEVQGRLDKAYQWYKQAADAGNPFGQYSVAMFHYDGRGVVQDLKLAAVYIKKAALQDFDMAQYQYGLFLLEGIGVNKNIKEGLDWIMKASEQNYLPARATLGEFLWRNATDQYDLELAKKLLKDGAEAGDSLSQCNYGEFLLRQGSEEERARGFDWIKKAADVQEPKAMLIYGIHLLNTSRDKTIEAMEYIKASVMKRYAPAQTFLGILILNEKKPEKYHYALPLLMDAASKNEPISMYYLGKMYEIGKGVEVNKERANKWYKKSCELGYKQACR